MGRTIFTLNESADKKESEPVDIPGMEGISSGIATLYGEINTEISKDICQWIIAENLGDNRPEVLTLMINSIGGDLHAGFAIIEVMTSSRIPVRTVALGEVMSCGLLIAMSGSERIITPSCSVMSHNYNTATEGSYDQLKDIRKELDRVNHKIIRHYKQCTKMTEAMIKKKLITSKDIYLDPEEAVKLGLFDAVSDLSFLYSHLDEQVDEKGTA